VPQGAGVARQKNGTKALRCENSFAAPKDPDLARKCYMDTGMFARLRTVLSTTLLMTLCCGVAAFGDGLNMKVTDSGYLSARGVSVMLYSDTYSPVFFDQKNAGMQIILHGHRIATNGSVRLMPTPEQWDRIPHFEGHQADKEHDRLTANLSYPEFHLNYQLVVAAEPGGVRVSVNLDESLPATLVGRAGFNLEFLPSIYMNKTYVVDSKTFGVAATLSGGSDDRGAAQVRRPEAGMVRGAVAQDRGLHPAAAFRHRHEYDSGRDRHRPRLLSRNSAQAYL
jgi:hypothetical protein